MWSCPEGDSATVPPTGPAREVDWIVPQDARPVRIDRLVAAEVAALSRSRARALIEAGEVSLDGVAVRDPAHIVRAGARIGIRIPPPLPPTQPAAAIPLDVVYEDEHLIVVNKQPGLVVHPAPGHHGDTLVNALLAHCGDSLSGIGGVARPGIVHRLDRDTSGLIIAAKTDEAHIRLAAAISAREVKRTYLAVCWDVPVPRIGRIDRPIGRHPRHRTRMAVVARGGRAADTRYRTLFDVERGSQPAGVPARDRAYPPGSRASGVGPLPVGGGHALRPRAHPVGQAPCSAPVQPRRLPTPGAARSPPGVGPSGDWIAASPRGQASARPGWAPRGLAGDP